MITVHVWLPKKVNGGKNVGHASLLVPGQAYVSWWPSQAVGPFEDFHPIRNKSYRSDVQDEGGRPDWSVHIEGLDEQAIVDWWAGFGMVRNDVELPGPMLPYNLLTQNCSTVVAMALKKGGAGRYAGWYSSWSIVWRPKTVLEFALSIKKALEDKQKP